MLFNQQQCFIYSTASFLSKLRAKVEKLCILVIKQLQQMTAYRNQIPEPVTTISGFADSKKKKKKKKKNACQPTLDFFDM